MATKSELYERAGKLGVANRDSLSKSDLAKAIKEKESKGNPLHVPTPSQTTEARGKSNEELAKDAAIETSEQKVKAAEDELEARAAKVAAEKKPEVIRRKIPDQFVMTKSCLVASNGILTKLAKGSIVSARTHNLNDIKRNGGEMEICKGTKLVQDQFGRLKTVPVM